MFSLYIWIQRQRVNAKESRDINYKIIAMLPTVVISLINTSIFVDLSNCLKI